MTTTVDALLPLSLLEAVRDVDRPVGDPDAEFVAELRNKRLGLSDTVHAQIRRYSEAVRRSQRQGFAEVEGLARLIGRRPDAEAIFRGAGKFLARQAYLTVPATSRRMLLSLPSLVARPLALRHARRVARRYFGGTVARDGSTLVLDVPASVTAHVVPQGGGCAYYEDGFRELLRLLVNTEPPVEHVSCAGRGEARCQWRADWTR
jgi:predicted hydrocarbon binding protein